jgi:DNA-binding LytR/AlgR family response regulator
MKFTYLIKPFHQFTLQSAIENAIQANDYEVIVNYHAKKHIIIRNGSSKQDRITFYEIVFLETDGNYSLIHTDSKKFALKKSLNKLLTEDFDEDFIRIHQQYAVNLQHVQVLREHTLQLAGKIDLPVGRTFNTIIRNKFK